MDSSLIIARNFGTMTARHLSAPARMKRPRRAAIGLCLCALTVLSVDSVQIPTYRKAQEPDAAPEDEDYNVARNEPSSTRAARPPRIPQSSSDEFMTWCTQVLGIETSLIIQDFEYPDFMRIRMATDDEEELCDQDTVEEEPILTVRGLAASRDIAVGDVVISIPFHALLTIPTTIDHDPVLSGLLGPSQRSRFGWEDDYFETPLLTIAILYHKHLGRQSPLQHYIQLLETNSPQDSMPLLWNRRQLRSEATSGVRKLVREIQSDVKEMYETVMVPLREDHAAIFGTIGYSLEHFQWAFAMVNSRHWYLPIPGLSERHTRAEESEYGGYEQVLPASQPTDEFVRQQGEQDADDIVAKRYNVDSVSKRDSHSFIAPVADLLNFGPPCTRGKYNDETKAFEIIATCPYLAGQEVTFWYADDCEDVIIANYGFTHPMVPRCPSADDWRRKSEMWKQRAESLEVQLEESYKELGRMDVELEDLRLILRKCDCDEGTPQPMPSQEAEEKRLSRDSDVPMKLRRFRPPEEPLDTADGLRGVHDESVEDHTVQHAQHGILRKNWGGSKSSL